MVTLVTRVWLWTQERVLKEDTDSVLRGYVAGRTPSGKTLINPEFCRWVAEK